MRYILYVCFLMLTCSLFAQNTPTSTNPGKISTTSGLPINKDDDTSFQTDITEGPEDSRIFKYGKFREIDNPSFFQKELPKGERVKLYLPGMVPVNLKLQLDETEVANIHWKEYLHHILMDSSNEFYNSMLPDETTEPVQGYFRDVFFNFYPVVGITYEQANAYCKWRQEKIIALMEKQEPGYFKKKKASFIMRLPSEAEWEKYAGCGMDLEKFPYGTNVTEIPVQIASGSGQYFLTKHFLDGSFEDVEQAIREFNIQKKSLMRFNVSQTGLPDFLKPVTPNYIWDKPTNGYGVYNLIGNVAEMVQEKGITKGGSYLDKPENCTIKSRGSFDGASRSVGFRVLAEFLVNEN